MNHHCGMPPQIQHFFSGCITKPQGSGVGVGVGVEVGVGLGLGLGLGLRCVVQNSEFRVQGSGARVQWPD